MTILTPFEALAGYSGSDSADPFDDVDGAAYLRDIARSDPFASWDVDDDAFTAELEAATWALRTGEHVDPSTAPALPIWRGPDAAVLAAAQAAEDARAAR